MRRPFWVVAAVIVGVLALASVASASVREEARSLAESVVAIVDDSGSPSPDPSGCASPDSETPASPLSEASEFPLPEASETAAPENHGAAVSIVAKDKSAVATRTLKNGKTITNHGAAVSAVARSKGGETSAHGKKGR